MYVLLCSFGPLKCCSDKLFFGTCTCLSSGVYMCVWVSVFILKLGFWGIKVLCGLYVGMSNVSTKTILKKEANKQKKDCKEPP